MTGRGIVILVVCAIGVYLVLRWVFTQVKALFSKQPKKKYIRIGHERKLVCYDDLPEANKYKGRTWLGGLPVYADVVIPDKHDYSTIIYMDHWFKQYVHDVMLNYKASIPLLVFPLMFVWLNPVGVLAITAVVLAWLHLWFFPSVERGERRAGETAKDFTPQTWAKIYNDVIKDLAEEERLVSALRRAFPPRGPL